MGVFSNPFKTSFALSVETFHTYELHFMLISTELSWIATRSNPTVSADRTLRGLGRFPSFQLHSPSKVLNKLNKKSFFFLLVPDEFKKESEMSFA